MRRARLSVVLLLALSFTAGTPHLPLPPPPAQSAPLRVIIESGVEIVVPKEWRSRRIGAADTDRHGVTASQNLRMWDARRTRAAGVEAYWVDATTVGVPTDYYYLAARGPAVGRFAGRRDCRALRHHVLVDHRPRNSSVGRSDFMALATGRCRSRSHKESGTRWASFVAAPGFGPARELGIAESGMYYAVVVVEEGPTARADMKRLLSSVRFGGTPVSRFLNQAGGGRLL